MPRPQTFYYTKKEHPKILQHKNFPIYGSTQVASFSGLSSFFCHRFER